MPSSCDNYSGLWEYSFRVMFEGDDQYMIVPIATFASTRTLLNATTCTVYVEMLDESLADSLQIVLGQMFFQSFNMFNQVTQNSALVTLTVNENALSATYLGSASASESTTDAFVIVPDYAPLDMTDQMIGLPTFSANLTGVPTDVSPYFLIDFSAQRTVVWGADCMQTILVPSGPCSDSPTYLQSVYTSKTTAIGTFSNMEFGGYMCSGSIYLDEICVSSSCKIMKIYVANLVSQNAWLYDQDGAYGILGYGPNSAFWNQYINTQGVATYSIELANIMSNPTQQNQAVMLDISNITFGSSGNQAANYADQPSLTISTAASDVTYNLTEFGFGIVYTVDGVDSSSYFQNLTTDHGVVFNTNFQGLGLPIEMY